MLLSKHRRGVTNAPPNANAISNFTALVGQMGWVTRQTRQDLAVDVNIATQSTVIKSRMW